MRPGRVQAVAEMIAGTIDGQIREVILYPTLPLIAALSARS
jgi:F-type H+-transporting ATPase subunit a